jgi:Uma2 family endonuclease
MSIPLRKPWTQEEFFAWAQDQEIRHEFDGFAPVAMTGDFANASAIGINLILALGNRLRGTGCRPLGPNAGVETINKAVRYPDALVTCTKFAGNARTLPGVVAVFEVVGNTRDSMRRDHFEKVKEYAAVPSIRRYVIIESSLPAVTVLSRKDADDPWTHTGLNSDDVLQMPDIGIEIPVAEFYDDISFDDQETSAV